jgi:hypothetical protein
MKLSYNVTGSERKRLAAAMGGILGSEPKYLGAPSFAYEVGGYRVDKSGTLTGPDDLDLEDSLHQAGFDPDGGTREYDEDDTRESGLGGLGARDEVPDIDQHHPGRYVNPDAPITETMQRQLDEVLAFEDPGTDGREETGLVVEMPRASFTDAALDNLKRLIESKSKLIRKALGAETLGLIITDDKVRFPWFSDGDDPEAVDAYTRFVAALCDMARSQKRVTAKEKETSNDKYAFRCFLLRLGFVGDEYKSVRKILLRNLSGNSAFKAPKGGDEHE